ncbi:hypothetical protein M1146_00195 [Patescibacteria group bacterium]|nr:hypothetical protein [Patescibacteria group bacterium]
MSAEALLAEANDLFVDEDYDGALEKFNAAIALNNSDGNYFTKRSACLHKLSRFNGWLLTLNTTNIVQRPFKMPQRQ